MQRVLVLVVAISVGFSVINAQEKMDARASAGKMFLDEFKWQEDGTGKKLIRLAEAMPAEKYSWRPSDGVRSVSEVFVHVASANYFFLSFVGEKFPEGFDREAEKNITEKSEVVELLKASFAFVREAAGKVKESSLGNEAKLPFRTTTVEGLYFMLANHTHEHLGQAIAYARMNGVTPPWSEKQ